MNMNPMIRDICLMGNIKECVIYYTQVALAAESGYVKEAENKVCNQAE